MKPAFAKSIIVVVLAIGGLSIAGPVAAQAAQGEHNFGRHVSHCAHVMGGFSGAHNPSMMHGTSWAEHGCHM